MLANNQGLDDIGVNIVQLRREFASLSENARLGTLGSRVRPMGGSRAAMTVNAFDIRATTSIETRCHACNEAESCNLFLSGVAIVDVCAAVVVGAFLAEEMDVAHLELLDTINFGFVIVLVGRIDALASSIACNNCFTIGRLVYQFLRGRGSGSGGLSCPAAHSRGRCF